MEGTQATHVLASTAVRSYITAGKAIVTILNTTTEGRHTYKIVAPGKTAQERSDAEICFVSVLTGPENTNDYTYIGVLVRSIGRFVTTKGSRLSVNDVRVKGIAWLTRNLNDLSRFENVEIRHHNHCGACSRLLTVPESIDTGLGPVCSKSKGIKWQRNQQAA